MTRILADLPDEDIAWLDALAAEQGRSRAAVLRDAVSAYKAQAASAGSGDWILRGAGLWKGRKDIPDGVVYQRAIRQDRNPTGDY